jgi:hypothetical protein
VFSNEKEVSYKQEQISFGIKKINIQQVISKKDTSFIFPTTFTTKLSSKKIIGIGEGTHGSLEFRILQQSIVKQLSKMETDLLRSIEQYVSKLNKNILLIELPKDDLSKMMIRDIGLVKRDCEQFNESRITIYDYIVYYDRINSTKIIPY